MKRILILPILAISLTGCQTNPVSGQRELTPAALEIMNRLGQHVLIEGEKVITAKVDHILRFDTGKNTQPVAP